MDMNQATGATDWIDQKYQMLLLQTTADHTTSPYPKMVDRTLPKFLTVIRSRRPLAVGFALTTIGLLFATVSL